MKKFLCLLMLTFLAFVAKSQYVPMNSAGYQFKGVLADTLMFATGCGAPVTTPGLNYRHSAIYYDSCGKGFYVYDPPTFTWNLIGSGDSNFPIYVDTLYPIDDSTFRWCKGSVCHDILIKGGDFIADPCIQPWQQTLINGPDLTQDNFSHDHNKIFTYDSLKQMIFHVLDWVDIIGDKDAGREYMLKMHVNDGGNSLMAFANATVTNGRFAPLIVGYQSPFPSPTTGGDLSFRGLVHPDNDIAGDPVFQFVGAGTHDDTDPNAPPLYMVNTKDIFAIGDSDLQYFMVKASGQLQFPMYVSGAFTGTAVNGLGVDASGNVIITSAVVGSSTVSNGMSMLSNDIQWGGTLDYSTYINTNTHDVFFHGPIGKFEYISGDTAFTNAYSLFKVGETYFTYESFDGAAAITDIRSTNSGGNPAVTLTAINGGGTGQIQVLPDAILLTGVESFANNTAAITGGLAVGTLYRNGDALQIVH